MTVLYDWDLSLDVDGVLRGQGADPSVIRARSTHLVQVAERALEEGRPLLEPRVLFRRMQVEALRHERLNLDGGESLSGALIGQHLGAATVVVVLLCTIGSTLEAHASEVMATEMLRGLALDGVGSAAVEALANAACVRLEAEAANEGLRTTIPLSPGMIGWTVAEGQPQIFTLLDGAEINVALNAAGVMVPRKSLSMVLGFGPDMGSTGKTCDYCSMRATCRYQDHYVPIVT